ncbi:MAG: IS66 family transposase [Candidatus Binatia bacterium]
MQQDASQRITELEWSNVVLQLENEALKSERARQDLAYRALLDKQKELLRRLYARRSEKMDPAQVELFREELVAEAAAELAAEIKAKADAATEPEEKAASKRNGRRRPPAGLRRERREYTLPESERICPCCSIPMQPFGQDVSEQFEYVPASLFVIEHARTKYACRGCEQGVATAPLPAQPIEKGLPGPGLLAHVVLSKYGHHLPLYRLEQIFAEQGVPISRKTMTDWVTQVAALLEPVVAEQKRRLLEQPLLQSDDTHVQYQDRTRKGSTARGFLWAYTVPWGEVVYDFTPTRARAAPQAFLAGYKGYLQVDGYADYTSIFPERPDATIGCMAHVRRKFFEARAEDREAADNVLGLIQFVYRVERRIKTEGLSGSDRVAVRTAEVLPALDDLEAYFHMLADGALPKSMIGTAARYALGQWPAIRRYVSVAEAEVDNNSCEQTMRVPVLGRKNWLFAGSLEGGRRGAVLFSLVVTCRRLGVDPAAYLVDVITRIATHPNSRIAELTPRGWKELQAAASAAA